MMHKRANKYISNEDTSIETYGEETDNLNKLFSIEIIAMLHRKKNNKMPTKGFLS